MFRCGDMFGQVLKSVSKKRWVNARESSDQIFQIAVINEYVHRLVEIRSVTSKIMCRKKKKAEERKKRKNAAVKYNKNISPSASR